MVVELNTGSVTIDFRFRPRPRAGAMVAGRVKMGPHDCLIRPQDLELRTIKSLVLTPMLGSMSPSATDPLGSHVGYRAIVLNAYMGSRGVLDTSRAPGSAVGNYARIRATMIGSFEPTVGGTTRVGSAVPGSFEASFLAFGE